MSDTIPEPLQTYLSPQLQEEIPEEQTFIEEEDQYPLALAAKKMTYDYNSITNVLSKVCRVVEEIENHAQLLDDLFNRHLSLRSFIPIPHIPKPHLPKGFHIPTRAEASSYLANELQQFKANHPIPKPHLPQNLHIPTKAEASNYVSTQVQQFRANHPLPKIHSLKEAFQYIKAMWSNNQGKISHFLEANKNAATQNTQLPQEYNRENPLKEFYEMFVNIVNIITEK